MKERLWNDESFHYNKKHIFVKDCEFLLLLINLQKHAELLYNKDMVESQNKYYGIVFGDFPILAVIITKQHAVIRDLPQDFPSRVQYEKSTDKSIPSFTHVAIGLIGVTIPLPRGFRVAKLK